MLKDKKQLTHFEWKNKLVMNKETWHTLIILRWKPNTAEEYLITLSTSLCLHFTQQAFCNILNNLNQQLLFVALRISSIYSRDVQYLKNLFIRWRQESEFPNQIIQNV